MVEARMEVNRECRRTAIKAVSLASHTDEGWRWYQTTGISFSQARQPALRSHTGPALSKEFLYVSEVQRESMVQPDGVTDDFGGEIGIHGNSLYWFPSTESAE
jgi:hypothetical protein